MIRYFTYRLRDDTPVMIARLHGTTAAERITRTSGPTWESVPALLSLVMDPAGPDMSWDEVDEVGAAAFVAELGYPATLVA